MSSCDSIAFMCDCCRSCLPVADKLRTVDRTQADFVGIVCPKLQPLSGIDEISGVVVMVACGCSL
jgi:hypothetical protein